MASQGEEIIRTNLALCLGLLIVLAGLLATAPRASAVSETATAISGAYDHAFESDFFITGCAPAPTGTPVTATLIKDGIPLVKYDFVCNAQFFGFIISLASSGSWTLTLATGGITFFVQSWRLPTLDLTATATPGQANTGDSVWIGATFKLKQGGVDYYEQFGGVLDVNGTKQTQTVFVTDAAYDAFLGAPTPKDHPFFTGRSFSFGTAGQKTVTVGYSDDLESLSAKATVSVSSPTDAALASARQDIAALQSQLSSLRANQTASDVANQRTLADQKARADSLQSRLDAANNAAATAQLVGIGGVVIGLVAMALAVVLSRRRPPVPSEVPPPQG